MECNKNCNPIPPRPVDALALERLWNKIRATFATRKDVLALANDLRRLEEADSVQAVQSGENGPVFPVGNDGIAHVKYENWVEGKTTDAAGRTVLTYNESTNAVTAAAAAMVLKSIRSDIKEVEAFKIRIVEEVDVDGHPVVDTIDYNTMYLTPAKGCEDDSNWDEWICVPQQNSRSPYKWEYIGNKGVDLKWVRKNFAAVNREICKLEHKLNHRSKFLAEQVLNKAIKPLEDLQAYIKSPEYIQYVFEQFPRAAMGTDGLMTANSFAILSMLAIWASNDHKIMGGGALGPDVVIHMFDKAGVPTDDLKEKYHHHGCCICED